MRDEHNWDYCGVSADSRFRLDSTFAVLVINPAAFSKNLKS